MCKASQYEKLVARFQGTFGIWDWLLVPMFIINMICVHCFSNLIGTFSLMFPTYIFTNLALHVYHFIPIRMFFIFVGVVWFVLSLICMFYFCLLTYIPTYKGSFGIVIVWN